MSTTMLRTDSRPRVSELNFPHPRIWHPSAPAIARQAANGASLSTGWQAWREHLASRGQPRPVLEIFEPRRSPLAWGTATLELPAESRDLLATLSRAACGHRAAGQAAAEVLSLWLRWRVPAGLMPCPP
jgi:hypothetical protein